jgi:hypothetical protein
MLSHLNDELVVATQDFNHLRELIGEEFLNKLQTSLTLRVDDVVKNSLWRARLPGFSCNITNDNAILLNTETKINLG